jgi:asparagine synthase (glutamine-hydrolysing)
MMYLDIKTYLPDDILVKVDRASMSTGLETRVPLLDHELIEWAWKLPFDKKLSSGKTKWALRQVLNNYVPEELIDRPKMGFGIPIDKWLSGELKEWGEDLLSEESLDKSNIFNKKMIKRLWDEHQSSKRRWHHQLWTILNFQAWYYRWHV